MRCEGAPRQLRDGRGNQASQGGQPGDHPPDFGLVERQGNAVEAAGPVALEPAPHPDAPSRCRSPHRAPRGALRGGRRSPAGAPRGGVCVRAPRGYCAGPARGRSARGSPAPRDACGRRGFKSGSHAGRGPTFPHGQAIPRAPRSGSRSSGSGGWPPSRDRIDSAASGSASLRRSAKNSAVFMADRFRSCGPRTVGRSIDKIDSEHAPFAAAGDRFSAGDCARRRLSG